MIRLNLQDSIKIAVVSPEFRLADIHYNKEVIIKVLTTLKAKGCQVVVFPELCLTGASCGDLFLQASLQEKALEALGEIADFVHFNEMVICIGLPLRIEDRLYNCAVLIDQDGIKGISIKKELESGRIRPEERWFTPGAEVGLKMVRLFGRKVVIADSFSVQSQNKYITKIVMQIGKISPLDVPDPKAIVVNPCAETVTVGSILARRERIMILSAENQGIIASVSSGANESTTDHLYSGQALIAAGGRLLCEIECLEFSTQAAQADINLITFAHSYLSGSEQIKTIQTERVEVDQGTKTFYPMTKTPFVPSDIASLDNACATAFEIQATGLARRLRATGSKSVVLGLSGGMDSSLALLVCVRAFEKLKLPTTGIKALFLPGPGTSQASRINSQMLAAQIGVPYREIAIQNAFLGHLRDIQHADDIYNLTYENAQARERTQILMDVASMEGGFVVGTGDMSELALGWCTYNADQMSMYNVNGGIPKTFIQAELAWYARHKENAKIDAVIQAILRAPISPELQPMMDEQTSPQRTEAMIGPYLLHDFFLFHTLQDGKMPGVVFEIACEVFEGEFSPAEILQWLRVFYKRFITQQYKRSAMPDCPAVFPIGLSPRAGWVMPSDASAGLWMDEIKALSVMVESDTEKNRHGR